MVIYIVKRNKACKVHFIKTLDDQTLVIHRLPIVLLNLLRIP
jgi:hypothetical protein